MMEDNSQETVSNQNVENHTIFKDSLEHKQNDENQEQEIPTKWTENKIKKEVIEALSDWCNHYMYCNGWGNVIEEELSVKDVSGHGGNRTYRITRKVKENVVAEVAFHLVGQKSNYKSQPNLLNVQKAATFAFASAGLCPHRLTEKEDKFFINEWFKNSKSLDTEIVDVVAAKQMGILLSKVHSIDQNWYSSHYEKISEEYPFLADVPQGSSFWYLPARNWSLMFEKEHSGSMDKWMSQLSNSYKHFIDFEIQPISSAGKRIVTTHGDFHVGNMIKSDEGVLNVIDFEQVHVSFAIQDISYFFCMLPCTTNDTAIKLAFCSAYLKEMGYPHDESDVFSLALDAERCTLSTGFLSPLFEAFVHHEQVRKDDLVDLHRLKRFADSTLKDRQLAYEIIEKGIGKCLPFICFGNECELGTILTVSNLNMKENKETGESRFQFLINEDGTIMPQNAPRWKGLVLGTDNSDNIVLTNHCNEKERLQLSKKITKSLPIKGYNMPKTKSFPLLLKSCNVSAKAIVRSEIKFTWFGNECIDLTVGNVEDTVHIYFEDDGAIRFADKPDQAFDCAAGKHFPGTKVHSYQYQDCQSNRFIRNADDTISPIENLDVILGLGDNGLELCDKVKVKLEERLVFNIPDGVGYSAQIVDGGLSNNEVSNAQGIETDPFSLVLDNPRGKGISFKPLEVDEDLNDYLENDDSRSKLSKLKLALVDDIYSAEAVLDTKSSRVRIINKKHEGLTPLDSNTTTEEQQFIRLGCWN